MKRFYSTESSLHSFVQNWNKFVFFSYSNKCWIFTCRVQLWKKEKISKYSGMKRWALILKLLPWKLTTYSNGISTSRKLIFTSFRTHVHCSYVLNIKIRYSHVAEYWWILHLGEHVLRARAEANIFQAQCLFDWWSLVSLPGALSSGNQ